MALTPLQTAQNNWVRRANLFRANNIPDSAWTQLYQHDMAGVYSGSEGMSDAEIFAGVQSVNKNAPQIADPQPQHGHGTILSDIGDTLGNVGHDISGIITGFPAGIAHMVAHFPSMATGTAALLYHLADGDQTWLQQQGYLSPDDTLHSGWSGFAQILRAMGENGDKQFLPYIPGLSDLADLTSEQGRQTLMQHPVGALLDVLPGIARFGKLATMGADFSDTAAEAAGVTKTAAGTPVPRFWAAGKALQKGNPLKALVSATGDLIPAGKDDFMTRLTLRQRLNTTAHTMGLDYLTREKLVRPFEEQKQLVSRQAAKYFKTKFGKGTVWDKLSPTRAHYLYLGAHGINPDTGELFASRDDEMAWLNSLPAEESAALDQARVLAAQQEAVTNAKGLTARIPDPHYNGTNVYSTDSDVYKWWKANQRASDRVSVRVASMKHSENQLNDALTKLQTRTGKFQGIMENDEAFARRGATPVTFQTARQALDPIADTFRSLGRVLGKPNSGLDWETISDALSELMPDARERIENMSARQYNQLIADISKLAGEDGLVAQLDNALATKNLRVAQRITTQIRRTLRHKAVASEYTPRLIKFFDGFTKQLQNMTSRDAKSRYALDDVVRKSMKHENDKTRVVHATAFQQATHQKWVEASVKEIPANWNMALVHYVREKALTQAKAMYEGQQLEDMVTTIKNSVWSDQLEQFLGKETYNAYVKDAIDMWHRMGQMGIDPLWTHHVDPQTFDHILQPTLDPKEFHDPGQTKARAQGLYFGSTVYDIAVSLTASQVEIFRQEAVESLINEHIIPQFTVSKAEKMKEFTTAITTVADKLHLHVTPAERAAQLIQEEFEDFNPDEFGVRRARFGHTGGNSLLIDKSVASALRKMTTNSEPTFTGKRWLMRGTSLYKFSVLTGPRHLAHVAFGGLAFMEGREPLAPLQFLRAAKILQGVAKAEDHGSAYEEFLPLMGKVYEIGPNHAWNHGIASRYGEDLTIDWVHQAKTSGAKVAEFIPNKLARLEETIMDMYRVSAYLSAKSRGLDRDAALEQARKVFVDINGMSLMERTAVKQVFPFYAFTRHLFRYLFQYPADYPLRASIITMFAEQEQADWNSGLPRSYMSLLWLGQPNAQGDINTIDLKNLNPFRSFANDFSFAGFFSSLSPFLTAPLAAVGVDTLSGTTQLYPGTTYNPQTGTLQATAPPGGLISVPEAFVPQFGLLDHYLKLTASTRYLAKFDPLSYRKQLYNMLNIPFVPEVINVPYEKEITEIRRFRAAQAAVTLVEKDPSASNVAALMEWNTVPWDNELIPPATIAAYYQRVQAALNQENKGYIAPKAAVQAPPRKPAVLGNF